MAGICFAFSFDIWIYAIMYYGNLSMYFFILNFEIQDSNNKYRHTDDLNVGGLFLCDLWYARLNTLHAIEHSPGIAPWPLFTHHWSGGETSGWGTVVGPNKQVNPTKAYFNFGNNSCINNIEVLFSYAFSRDYDYLNIW